jgi:hypothetical protein
MQLGPPLRLGVTELRNLLVVAEQGPKFATLNVK